MMLQTPDSLRPSEGERGRENLAAMKAEHRSTEYPERVEPFCAMCGEDWPCEVSVLVAALDEALDRLVARDGTLSDVDAVLSRLAGGRDGA